MRQCKVRLRTRYVTSPLTLSFRQRYSAVVVETANWISPSLISWPCGSLSSLTAILPPLCANATRASRVIWIGRSCQQASSAFCPNASRKYVVGQRTGFGPYGAREKSIRGDRDGACATPAGCESNHGHGCGRRNQRHHFAGSSSVGYGCTWTRQLQ